MPESLGECVERERLRALHVGGIAGQEDKRRRRTRAQPVGDLPPATSKCLSSVIAIDQPMKGADLAARSSRLASGP